MIDEHKTSGTAVVIGAGIMGSGIAADLANAGWQVRLLDVAADLTGESQERSAAAKAGLERVRKSRPALLFLPEFITRIQAGNTSDHMEWLRDADWVVEAVAERMDVKQAVLEQIELHCGPDAVVSSNTSGLSLREMAQDRSADFQARFLGSHFLNPPRYLKLLEVIPLPATDPDVAAGFVRFAEQVLGHRVVLAKDTPGFISTRIWIQHLMATIRIALDQGLTIEETDLLTGTLLGRPKSATLRMADLVGLDIVAAIAGNQYSALPDDPFRDQLVLPTRLNRLINENRLGDKTGAGFYKRDGKAILTLDLEAGEYRPRQDPELPGVGALLKRPLAERLAVLAGERDTKAGRFVNAVLDSLHDYVDYVGPLIAADTMSVDNVMRWGFQWDMGPFAIEERRSGPAPAAGAGPARTMHVFGIPGLQPVPRSPEYLSIEERKADGQTIFQESDGALIDLGDGVVCLEFRTKMNTIAPGLCAVIDRAREIAERDFAALVIGADTPHFSAGYNLKMLLDAALTGDWEGIDSMLQGVQSTYLRLKYSPIPIVAAVRGYTLGAGCECAFHCAAAQAAPELSMGLPEISAGLVPGAGGVKELLSRGMEGWDGVSDSAPRVLAAFRTIAVDGASGSAEQARKSSLLRPVDSISRNADRLLFDAKRKGIKLSEAGYTPSAKTSIYTAGALALEPLRGEIDALRSSGTFTDYDAYIAAKLAHILSGGVQQPQTVDEEHLLSLEREALISLAGEPKSNDRMKSLLETGKPLRN